MQSSKALNAICQHAASSLVHSLAGDGDQGAIPLCRSRDASMSARVSPKDPSGSAAKTRSGRRKDDA